jgi:hypothetical protein
MIQKLLSLIALLIFVNGSSAFAWSTLKHLPRADEHYIVQMATVLYVVQNNVPKNAQPNAAGAGEWVTLPEQAVISVLGVRQDNQFGTVLNISLDTEPDSKIPMDFDVAFSDFKTASIELLPEDLIAKMEAASANQTEAQAIQADIEDQLIARDGYFTSEASRRGGTRHAGRGGARHAGMTYCLANVEDRAKQMGVCSYRVHASPQGWARTSLPGFIADCNMTQYHGSDYQSLPIGSICVSHGTFHHYCGGQPCGDAKIKVGARSWYGVGYSIAAGIGDIIGCAIPSGLVAAYHSVTGSASDSDSKKTKSGGTHSKSSHRRRHHRH